MNSKKLHPVIKHLLARKNKKVPVKDGRKIALVLFGGAMAGVRGGGFMIALNELGFDNAFDEIYSSSAGFCNASYLLSGNPQEGTSLYYEEFKDHNFIDLRKVWNIADIDYVVRCTKKSKPLNVKNVLAHPTKLFVQINNINKDKIEFHEVHKNSLSGYFSLLKAAIKMPYLSPGGVHIGRGLFKDTFEEKILKKVFDSDATDIIIQYNIIEQHKNVHKHFDKKIFRDGRVLEIKPNSNPNLSFLVETNSQVLKKECISIGTKVKKIFGSKKSISLKYVSTKK
jgi:hypothetical protein